MDFFSTWKLRFFIFLFFIQSRGYGELNLLCGSVIDTVEDDDLYLQFLAEREDSVFQCKANFLLAC